MTAEEESSRKTRAIRAVLSTRATPEQVWRAWTDPEKLAQWFVDRAQGEPRAGSTFTWFFDKFGVEFPYEVVEAVAGERFALRGIPPGRPPSLLEISIEREEGQTIVTLVNSGFLEGAEWNEEYEGVVSGWIIALEILKHYLENHFGQPKTGLLALAPAQFEYERLLPLYTTAEGLSAWLTSSGGFGQPGEPYAWKLRDGTSLVGRVLAVTRHEVAVTCAEIQGVLELKAFGQNPDNRRVGLRATCWELEAERARRFEQQMNQAVHRLVALLG